MSLQRTPPSAMAFRGERAHTNTQAKKRFINLVSVFWMLNACAHTTTKIPIVCYVSLASPFKFSHSIQFSSIQFNLVHLVLGHKIHSLKLAAIANRTIFNNNHH